MKKDKAHPTNSNKSSQPNSKEVEMCKDSVIVYRVKTDNDLRNFVKLKEKLYQDDPFWPGQDVEKEVSLHSPEFNQPLTYIDNRLFLAEKDGEIVGRISVSINERHNEYWDENVGFFGHFESINDQLVADCLFESAINWLKENGKEIIYGPFSYTYADEVGIQVEGFGSKPTIGLAHNPEYYPKLVEKAGFNKLKDLLEYMATVNDLYERAQKFESSLQSIINDDDYNIRSIDRDNYYEDLEQIRNVYNDAFSEHWMVRQLNEEEWLGMMEEYCRHIPDELFIIVEHKGKIIAFQFSEEDNNQLLYNKRNNLDNKVDCVKAYMTAIAPEYQSTAVGRWLFYETSNRLIEKPQYTHVSLSWIDEAHRASRFFASRMGGSLIKKFRVYTKNLK